MIVKILILFFTLLLIYQFILAFYDSKEGFQDVNQSVQQYKPYDINDPNSAMILSQQNAGNIEYLKQQITSLLGLEKKVSDVDSNVQELNDQMVTLTQQQQQAAAEMTGTDPVQVSGLTESDSSTASPF